MIKKIILALVAILLIGGGIFYMKNSKDTYDKTKFFAKATDGLNVGSKIELKLPDQFDKEKTLTDDTKKVIFAFSKNTGHTIREFFGSKDKGYLESKKAILVADVSKMPVFIRNTFALPDLKKSPYSILLIYDKSIATTFEKGIDKDKVVVLDIKNREIIGKKYAKDIDELEKLLK